MYNISWQQAKEEEVTEVVKQQKDDYQVPADWAVADVVGGAQTEVADVSGFFSCQRLVL